MPLPNARGLRKSRTANLRSSPLLVQPPFPELPTRVNPAFCLAPHPVYTPASCVATGGTVLPSSGGKKMLKQLLAA
jgi:hypothetical protein